MFSAARWRYLPINNMCRLSMVAETGLSIEFKKSSKHSYGYQDLQGGCYIKLDMDHLNQNGGQRIWSSQM